MNKELLQQALDVFINTLSVGAQANILDSANRNESITVDAFRAGYYAALAQPVQQSKYGSPELQTMILNRLAQPVQPAVTCFMCHGEGWYYGADAYPPGMVAPKIKITCTQCATEVRK